MKGVARIVIALDIEFDDDAAGDRDMPQDIAEALASHVLGTWDPDQDIIAIRRELDTKPSATIELYRRGL